MLVNLDDTKTFIKPYVNRIMHFFLTCVFDSSRRSVSNCKKNGNYSIILLLISCGWLSSCHFFYATRKSYIQMIFFLFFPLDIWFIRITKLVTTSWPHVTTMTHTAISNSWQWISRVCNRWRTWQNAISRCDLRISWNIEFLNALHLFRDLSLFRYVPLSFYLNLI